MKRDLLLDVGTGALVLVALAFAVTRLKGSSQPAGPASPREVEERLLGSRPTPLEVSAKGRTLTLFAASSRGPAVVLLFSGRCAACIETKPAWERALSRLDPSIPRYAIALDDLPGDDDSIFPASLRVQVVRARTASDVISSIETPYLPTTLVLSAGGSIAYVRTGLLGAVAADSIVLVAERERRSP